MIYVVGIGSGRIGTITPEALEVLRSCGAVVGYTKYVDMIRGLLPEKLFITSGMTQEVSRCQKALSLAQNNSYDVALVSSGDSGVYGMAGLMLEIASGSGVEVRVIPGVTAANLSASVLGAPLMNDYVTISLSDLMTEWSVIEMRLEAACKGDFVICIYNPSSRKRQDKFKRACDILLCYKTPETPSGFVRNAGRDGEHGRIMTLSELRDCDEIDMSCTVIVGNSQSYILDGKIITARGYQCIINPYTFYSEKNMAVLMESVRELDEGRGQEHELLDD